MDQWTAWVLIALGVAIFLQIDWAMYLFAVMLVGLALLAQRSETVVTEKIEEIAPKSEPQAQPTQIIVTQPTGSSYIDQVYANLMTEAMLRGKRGLRQWSKRGIAARYSTLESGLGEIEYVEQDILKAVKSMNKSIDSLSKRLESIEKIEKDKLKKDDKK